MCNNSKSEVNDWCHDGVKINRPIYSQDQFEQEFRLNNRGPIPKRKRSNKRLIMNVLNPIRLLNVFTIFDVLSSYKWRLFLVPDLLCGITAGVVSIPAALAYGSLTSLNPIHGFYTSLYAGLIYGVFGTSKHLSVGTFAVTSIMVYSTISRVEADLRPQINPKQNTPKSLNSSSFDSDHNLKLNIAISLAFWCGAFQIAFSMLRLGNIYRYLPEPLLEGFTTAAAFHVLTSQIKHVLGIHLPEKRPPMIFYIFYTYLEIFQHIGSINWIALSISIVSVVFLVLFKTYVNGHFRRFLGNFIIPVELFVIILTTLVSSAGDFKNKYKLSVVGLMPRGLAKPLVPDFSLFLHVAQDALIISVVGFTTTVSIADVYARKHKYKIDSNKELFALGMANLVGSFFQSFVSCASLSRTAVNESSGGKTQVVGLVSSGILLIVVLWLTTWLINLPKACIASIIIAALLNILKRVKDVTYYWHIDKLDCLIWVVTFASVIIVDIGHGLFIGVMTVLFLNTHRNRNLELQLVGRIRDSEIYSDVNKFNVDELEAIKIVRPSHSISYLNSDSFRDKLNSLCPLKDPTIKANKCPCFNIGKSNTSIDDDSVDVLVVDLNQNYVAASKQITAIVLDCSNVTFIDEAGFSAIKFSIAEYQNAGIRFFLACCHERMLSFFAKMKYHHLDTYVKVQDAVEIIKRSQLNSRSEILID